MELKPNQVVKLRNGIVGVTASFNGKVFQLIFKAYSCPIGRYNENLKTKNNNYDITGIYDGSAVEKVTDVFKNKFAPEEKLPVVWEEGK